MSGPNNDEVKPPRWPGVILKDCSSVGNGGAGFRFENADALGINLIARENGGDGIEVIDSDMELDDPTVE